MNIKTFTTYMDPCGPLMQGYYLLEPIINLPELLLVALL